MTNPTPMSLEARRSLLVVALRILARADEIGNTTELAGARLQVEASLACLLELHPRLESLEPRLGGGG